MSEGNKKLLSQCVGGIETGVNGRILVGGRIFQQAIAIIGGGTGFEALTAAEEFQEAAIVVIDPLGRFGRNVLRQLHRDVRGRRGELDLGFVERDYELRINYPGIWDVYAKRTPTWNGINQAYYQHRETARDARQRIFFVEDRLSHIKADKEIFDVARMIYPDMHLWGDYEQFNFMAQSLKDGATLEVITEQYEVLSRYQSWCGGSITRRGYVNRPEGIKQPLSPFDFLLGYRGYYFFNIQKENEQFPQPNRALFELHKDTMSHVVLSVLGSPIHFLRGRRLPPAENLTEE